MNEDSKSENRMNLLLFLGAGFSVEAGLPTQKNFFKHARNEYKKGLIDPHQYSGITAAQSLVSATSSIYDSEPTMEDAFSMLDYIYYMKNDDYKLGYIWDDVFIPSKDSQLNVVKAREYFLSALEYLFNYNRAECKYINHDLYYYFLDELLKHYNVYIITTNYDLVCESVLDKMIGRDVIIFPSINYDEYFGHYIPVPLLKLHGSIDWKETQFDVPNIIPPTWSKQFERKGKYNYIWNQAEKAITYNDKIMFIGYSMPEIDIHIKYLITLGLLNSIIKEVTKEIYIVKPNWNEKDNINFKFLKENIPDRGHNYYNVKFFRHIPKTFKELVESDFIDILKNQ